MLWRKWMSEEEKMKELQERNRWAAKNASSKHKGWVKPHHLSVGRPWDLSN